MRVRVLFFGILKEMIGKSADLIDLPDGASVRDVLARYESQIPRLKESLPSLALAVNQQYAGPDTPLRPNDEVAMLPPVSGGAIADASNQGIATVTCLGGESTICRARYAIEAERRGCHAAASERGRARSGARALRFDRPRDHCNAANCCGPQVRRRWRRACL